LISLNEAPGILQASGLTVKADFTAFAAQLEMLGLRFGVDLA